MRITAISDLHGHFPKDLPGGDLLIVAGDLTRSDMENEYALFDYWLNDQKYLAKIIIAGNHDNFLQTDGHNAYGLGHKFIQFGTYLQDASCMFNGLKIWGSPWTKRFEGMNPNCMAFTVDTDEELAEKWALIPEDVDILVTHCPPIMTLDEVEDYMDGQIRNVGSLSLATRIFHVNPRLVVFGHIHEGYGIKNDARRFMRNGKLIRFPIYVNASHVNEHYEPVNKPIRIEL